MRKLRTINKISTTIWVTLLAIMLVIAGAQWDENVSFTLAVTLEIIFAIPCTASYIVMMATDRKIKNRLDSRQTDLSACVKISN